MKDKNEVKQQFVELRAKGNSYDRIANQLKVSKGTLIEWSRVLSTEIGNLKNVEADALLEKHKMAKAHQIEIYGTQLKRVRDELAKRDFGEVSTDKLFTMELKLLESINKTSGDIKFSSNEIILEMPSTYWEA